MDIVSRVSEMLTNEGIEEKRIVYIETQLRHEYSGSYTYIQKRSPEIGRKIKNELAKRRGDIVAIARQFNVHRSTVYKYARELRKTS